MSEKDKYVAELMRQDFYRLMEAFRPLLLSHGYFTQTVDTWITKVKEELAAMEKKMYVRVSTSIYPMPLAHPLSLSVALFVGDQAEKPLGLLMNSLPLPRYPFASPSQPSHLSRTTHSNTCYSLARSVTFSVPRYPFHSPSSTSKCMMCDLSE